MTYDCMSEEELALWQTPNSYVRTKTPCIDCPMWFHLQEKAAGRCNNRPGFVVRPLTEERRSQIREASRRYRKVKRNRQYRATLRAQVEAVRLARAAVQS